VDVFGACLTGDEAKSMLPFTIDEAATEAVKVICHLHVVVADKP